MIAESIAFCRENGKRAVFDAEHFFDGYRDDAGYALRVRARRRGGRRRERHPLRHQRRQPAVLRRRRRPPPSWRSWARRVEVGIHTHNDAECAVANSLAAVEAGARLVQGTVNGYGERCGNANLASILPALQLKMGFDVVSAEQLAGLTSTAHYLDELCNMAADPDQPYVGRNAFAHKAGMHAAGVKADPRTFEHLDPQLVGNDREILVSELSGKATIRSPGRSGSGSTSTRRRRRGRSSGSRSASTAATTTRRRRPPSSCCCGRRRGATRRSSELESFRVTTEKRADGAVETEATIKVEVEGERYVKVAEGNGPVNALDRALRGGDRRPPPAPGRHRADQLQGPHPRRDPRHRGGHPGPARLLRRRARVGHDRRLREHHRGLLGGARRLARVRIPATEMSEPLTDNETIPLARPELGEREEELVLEVLRSGRLSLGPIGERFERAFAEWLGVEDAVAVSSGTTGLHLGVRALGWGEGDEVLTSPFSFVASANCLLYEGARPVFCDVDPVTLDLDPAAAEAAVGERTAGLLPVHIFGYPAAMAGARGDRGRGTASASSRTPARRSARSTPRAAGSAPAATSPPSPSTPTSR